MIFNLLVILKVLAPFVLRSSDLMPSALTSSFNCGVPDEKIVIGAVGFVVPIPIDPAAPIRIPSVAVTIPEFILKPLEVIVTPVPTLSCVRVPREVSENQRAGEPLPRQ